MLQVTISMHVDPRITGDICMIERDSATSCSSSDGDDRDNSVIPRGQPRPQAYVYHLVNTLDTTRTVYLDTSREQTENDRTV
jgi:hypothetical protein